MCRLMRRPLYFVVETKSSLFDDQRNAERAKSECGIELVVGDKPAICGKFRDVAGLVERA